MDQEGLITCKGGLVFVSPIPKNKILKFRVLGNNLFLFVIVSQEDTLWEFLLKQPQCLDINYRTGNYVMFC